MMLKKMEPQAPVDLFEAKRLRGFWPCYNDDGEFIRAGVCRRTLAHAPLFNEFFI